MTHFRKFIDLGILVAVAVYLVSVFGLGAGMPFLLELTLPVAWLAAMVWFVFSWRWRSDEVEVSDAKNSWVIGAGAGLALAFLAAVALTTFPALATPALNAGWLVDNPLPPAIIGFTLGVLTCIVLAAVGYYGACLYWWLDRRSSH